MAVDPIIKQKADDIRHKIYGKEVRESLASGIEAISEDVEATIGRQDYVEEQFQDVLDETTGKDVISAPEIILARGGAQSLGERLDSDKAEVTAQLAQRPSYDETRLKSVKLEPEDLSEETLGLVTGTGTVNLLSIPQDNSVTLEKISTELIEEKSTNLFDKTKVTNGYTINGSTGELSASATNSVSDFIPILASTQYIGYPIAKKAFYDSNKIFISSDTLEGAFATPSNATYIRLVIGTTYLDFAQLNKGGTLLPFEPFYLTFDKVKVDTKDLKGKNITPKMAKFIQESTNLFDTDEATKGYTIAVDGTLAANVAYAVSDYIEVKLNTVYSTSHMARVAFYDINKIFVNTTLISDSFTTPPRAYYARVVADITKLDNAQVNEGSNLVDYESSKFRIKKLNVTNDNLENNTITSEKTAFVETSTNLFNKDEYTVGNIDNSTGKFTESIYHKISNRIEVNPDEDLVSNVFQKYAFFTKNMEWIKNIYPSVYLPDITPVTVPPNAYYVKGIYSTSDYSYETQTNRGSTLLPYEPFYAKVSGAKIYGTDKILDIIQQDKYSIKAVEKKDKFIVNGVLDKTYSAPVIPDYLSLVNTVSTDIFALYDDLVASYSHYVTKITLGQNSLGQDIYRYDFKPTPVDPVGLGTKIPKMILISGVHPEKAGVYNLYQTMKQICENWESDESLETLRWNVHFVVVPIVNRYGYDNNTRKNHNGVDIARNFEIQWNASDPSSPTYGGTAPLSEKESQLVDTVLSENKDAIFFTSFHNFWSDTNQNYFIWNAASTQLQIHIGKQLISKMSRKWKKEYTWLPQDETTFFGHANDLSPQGSEGKHAVGKYGIQGGTFEVCADFMLETGHQTYNSLALTLGLETFVNFLLLNLKHNVEFYNEKK